MKTKARKDDNGTAKDLYFHDLRALPVLTHEDEVELAKEIERGEKDALRAVVASKEALQELGSTELARSKAEGRLGPSAARRVLRRLDKSAHAQAASNIRSGLRRADAARTKLVRGNMRLVVWMAKRQMNRGLPLVDLVQEGNIGLMRAADKFDHRRGVRFNTYAVWWIRQAINRALSNHARTIRMPVHLVEKQRKLALTLKRFAAEHGREPTVEEAAAETGFSLAKVRDLMDVPREPVSMDAMLGPEGDTKLGDFVADPAAQSPIESISKSRLPDKMRRILTTLTPREQEVLRMRFGIDLPEGSTLQDIGHAFALSRERVRQIESQALGKLRELAEAEELDSHLAS